MDGQHPTNRRKYQSRQWRCFGVSSQTSILWTVVLAASFAGIRIANSAEGPGKFIRSVFRAKEKAKPTADVPSKVAPSHLTDSGVSKPSEKQSAGNSAGSNNTASLERFPHKTTDVDTSLSGPIDDSSLGFDEKATSIDLPAALQLAGMKSPQVLLAQQRVLAVTARQQLAAAQALPNLNLGTTYNSHTGALQTSGGQILNVQRSSLYVGAGGNAVGSGTVNVPGLQYNMNVGEAYFAYLVSRQRSEQSQAGAVALQNDVLMQIAIAYCQLVQAQGARAIAVKVRDDAVEVARITETFAESGQGRPSDAERAKTEVGMRDADIFAADSAITEASARLVQLLNLESSVRLQANESWIVPRSIVPEPIPLPELIAIALYQRPEIAERRAQVHAAMLELDRAKLLLFSPQFIAGFSDGAFGGGSDINAATTGKPRFGSFGDRTDVDVVLYWSIRNLGLANRALIKMATAQLAATDWERTKQFNDIRAQVADAYARTQASSAQLDILERAVAATSRGFKQDLNRAYAGEALPIEVLDNLRLRAIAQQEYLEMITTYNQAQYELYVSIGQPPADLLIHTSPAIIPPSPVEDSK